MKRPEDNFASLFEFLPIGAYRSWPEGRQLRANPALVRLNGFVDEAEQLATVSQIATEWYVDAGRRALFKQLLERDGQVAGFQSEIFRYKSRERIWVRENAHVVRDSSGQVLFYEGTVEEITERKRAEQDLRENSEVWKRALESSGDGVWDWHVADRVEILSPQCKALYGYAGDELPDDPDALDIRTHPDDLAAMRRDREAHFAGQTAAYINEHRVRCKDGRWKWILARGIVISRDEQGRPQRMAGTHTDITAHELADELRLERDRAEAADLAKSQFLSRVSHELRTPLNAILGFSQLLELEPALAAHPVHLAWVRQVLSSGRHLLGLMDDILDLSSAQTGQLSVNVQPLRLPALLGEVWGMLAEQAQQAGVAYTTAPTLDTLPGVLADGKRLKQVLANLLSNAVKYNRPGGWVRVSAEASVAEVVVSVADNGVGLTEEQCARLFQPFERLGAQRGPVPGSGLGLALSRQLTEAMGGRIDASSLPGQGSVFRVTLPRA